MGTRRPDLWASDADCTSCTCNEASERTGSVEWLLTHSGQLRSVSGLSPMETCSTWDRCVPRADKPWKWVACSAEHSNSTSTLQMDTSRSGSEVGLSSRMLWLVALKGKPDD